MTQYVARFSDGSTGAIRVRGMCPDFVIGLAKREDGYMRCLFIGPNDTLAPDPWVTDMACLDAPSEPVEVVVARNGGV
jgi:hypothetical protein